MRNFTQTLRFFSITVALLACTFSKAQTTISSFASGTNYTGGNGVGGNSAVTFAVQNTSGNDIILTQVDNFLQTGNSNANVTLWYSATSLSGPVTISTPNWTQVATAGPIAVPSNGVYPLFTGLSLLIPNGTTYRFAIQSSNGIRYSGATPTPSPSTFTSGGVTLLCGNAQISAANVGYGGAFPSPANNPRWFTGGITFVLSSPCSGQPTPGLTTSNANPVCPSVNFNLGIQNANLGTGVTYQWQTSADGLTWTNVGGATNSSLTTSQTANTYYRNVVTCTNSGLTAISDSLLVTTSSFINCYCASNATNSADTKIDSVSFAGAVFGSPSSTCETYTNNTSTTIPVLRTVGYPIVIRNGSCSGTHFDAYVGVYIDYNQNGLFTDAGELVYSFGPTTALNTVPAGNINIPAGAALGQTRMRVVLAEGSAVPPSCGTYGYGETEDYLLDIQPAPACVNPPVAGTISGISSLCPTATTTLTLSGNSLGTNLQWQVSTDSITWANVAGATNVTYTTPAFTSKVYYRVKVTCVDSAFTAVHVINATPFLNCYCASNATNTADTKIDSVSFNGFSFGSGAAVCETYTNNSTPVIPVLRSIAYPIQIRNGSCSGTHYTAYVSVYIDFNQNGVLNDAGEQVYTFGPTTALNTIPTGNILIPASALLGQTRMRVVLAELSSAPPACGTYAYGETEDYILDIQPAPTCSNPPTAGTVSGGTSSCPGSTTTLSLNGYTLGSSLQWQSSTDSLVWNDVAGAINAVYTTPAFTVKTYYRVKVTCVDSVFSNVHTINATPFFNCYCVANIGGACPSSTIQNFSIAATTFSNSSACGPLVNGSYYTAYDDTGSATATLYLGTTYTFSVILSEASIVSVWIDYNQNGVYEASEWTQVTTNSSSAAVAITVPITALTGQTGMRIRSRLQGNQNGAGDACTNMGSGETEDYIITLANVPPCTTPPAAGVATGPDTVGVFIPETYTLSGSTGTVQWQTASSPTGPWTSVAGANDSIDQFALTAIGTFYVRALAVQPGCPSDSSNVLTVVSVFKGDNVCDAIPLNFGTNGPFNTSLATTQSGEPAPPATGCTVLDGWCNNAITNTLWFTFTAPASGRVRLQSPSFDTQLALWDAPNCDTILLGGATLVAANDDNPDNTANGGVVFSSFIDSAICLTPGKVYYVQLDAYSSPGGSTTLILTDLGPGPDATFNNLNDVYCPDGAPVALQPVTPGGSFFGFGVVQDTLLDPAQVAQQLGIGLPNVIYYQLWACYQTTDTMRVDSLPSVAVNGITNVSCFGGNNGAIDLNSFGNAPFAWAWSNAATTEDVSGLTAGSYSVTITDANGCSGTSSPISITEPTALTASLDSLINVSCFGLTDGAIYVSIAGGTTPYSYNWSNGDTVQDLINIGAGVYTGTVSDALGCTLSSPQLTITEPAQIVVTVDSILNVNCFGETNGRIYVTTANGATPLVFNWSDGSTSEDLSGVAGGVYTLSVTDANGCSATPVTDTVASPPQIVVTPTSVSNVTCNGAGNGAVNVTVAGGSGTFAFAWSNNATTEDLSGLSGGSYTLTVTDANGCTAVSTSTITEPAALSVATGAVTNVNCFGNSNGSVQVNVNGGTPAYTYSWNTGATTEDLSNLGGGSYTLTVTDANGCTSTISASVNAPAAALTCSATNTAQVQGGANGTVDLTVNGGTTPYIYSWSNGATTEDLGSVAAGVYNVTVTDANGCTATATTSVSLIIGIEETNSSIQVSLYPNPARDVFFAEVNMTEAKDINIALYSVNGQLISAIEESNISTGKFAFDMVNEAEGVYYVRIKAGESVTVKKVVISR